MTTRSAKLGMALLMLFAVAGAAIADDAATFRYKMEKDQPQVYRLTQSMKQTQEVNDQTIETEMKQTTVNVRTLEKVDEEGNLHIKTETRQLKINLTVGPLGEYKYDSTAAEQESGTTLSEQLNPIFDRLSVASLTATVTPQGEITKVEGFEEAFGELLKENPLGAQFAGGGSDEAAKISLSDQFIQFSQEPVKPGDSWEKKYEADLPRIGKAKGKQVYTYAGPEKVGDRPTAKFTVTYELSMDVDINAGGSKVTGTLSTGDASGTVHFDPEKGCIVSKEGKFTLSGNLNVTAGDQNLTVETSQTHASKLELLDKLPGQ